jgi:hypothetical protein
MRWTIVPTAPPAMTPMYRLGAKMPPALPEVLGNDSGRELQKENTSTVLNASPERLIHILVAHSLMMAGDRTAALRRRRTASPPQEKPVCPSSESGPALTRNPLASRSVRTWPPFLISRAITTSWPA